MKTPAKNGRADRTVAQNVVLSERAELVAVEAKLDAARETLDAAELVWRRAQQEFVATSKPLWARHEALLCNADEWPEDQQDQGRPAE
jgi:hypothetical protein